MFAAQDGELLGVVEKLTVRTSRQDGTGLAVAGHTRPVSVGLREQLTLAAWRWRYVTAITYAWTSGDLAGLWGVFSHGELTRAGALAELGRIVRVAALADAHVTWSWRDPAPTLATCWRYLALARQRRTAAQGPGGPLRRARSRTYDQVTGRG